MPRIQESLRFSTGLFLAGLAGLTIGGCSPSDVAQLLNEPDPFYEAPLAAPPDVIPGLWGQYEDANDGFSDTLDTVVRDTTAPASGRAIYGGTLNFFGDPAGLSEDVTGSLSLEVSFDTNSVNGTATDFVNLNDEVYSGEIALTGGALDRDQVVSGGTIPLPDGVDVPYAGTLVGPGGEAFEISGEIFDAGFYDNGTIINGAGSGPITLEDGTIVIQFAYIVAGSELPP